MKGADSQQEIKEHHLVSADLQRENADLQQEIAEQHQENIDLQQENAGQHQVSIDHLLEIADQRQENIDHLLEIADQHQVNTDLLLETEDLPLESTDHQQGTEDHQEVLVVPMATDITVTKMPDQSVMTNTKGEVILQGMGTSVLTRTKMNNLLTESLDHQEQEEQLIKMQLSQKKNNLTKL